MKTNLKKLDCKKSMERMKRAGGTNYMLRLDRGRNIDCATGQHLCKVKTHTSCRHDLWLKAMSHSESLNVLLSSVVFSDTTYMKSKVAGCDDNQCLQKRCFIASKVKSILKHHATQPAPSISLAHGRPFIDLPPSRRLHLCLPNKG